VLTFHTLFLATAHSTHIVTGNCHDVLLTSQQNARITFTYSTSSCQNKVNEPLSVNTTQEIEQIIQRQDVTTKIYAIRYRKDNRKSQLSTAGMGKYSRYLSLMNLQTEGNPKSRYTFSHINLQWNTRSFLLQHSHAQVGPRNSLLCCYGLSLRLFYLPNEKHCQE
jgi:hypothetical protein